MTAAASTPQLGSVDLDDLYTGLGKQSVGFGIAVISNNDTRLKGHHIVAVIPLFTLSLPAITTGLHGTQTIQP